jgi:hypothetical protein
MIDVEVLESIMQSAGEEALVAGYAEITPAHLAIALSRFSEREPRIQLQVLLPPFATSSRTSGSSLAPSAADCGECWAIREQMRVGEQFELLLPARLSSPARRELRRKSKCRCMPDIWSVRCSFSQPKVPSQPKRDRLAGDGPSPWKIFRVSCSGVGGPLMFTSDAQTVIDRAKDIAVSNRINQLNLDAIVASLVMDSFRTSASITSSNMFPHVPESCPGHAINIRSREHTSPRDIPKCEDGRGTVRLPE